MTEHFLTALEKATRKHEKNMVTEFGVDRFLQFASVRLVIILAIVSKLTEFKQGNLTCHPAYNETGFDMHFATFAKIYCWESPVVHYRNESVKEAGCDKSDATSSESRLLNNPETVMHVMRWLPYALLLEAFLFCLPSAWWHFPGLIQLMTHLKFTKLFLEELSKGLKIIPAGLAYAKPYDKESQHLDGRCKKQMEESTGDREGKGEIFKEVLNTVRANDIFALLPHQGPDQRETSDSKTTKQKVKMSSSKKEKGTQKRKMLDRHLYSMLCYENFSSMEYYPYILSILRATYAEDIKEESGIFPLNQGILQQWRHRDSFSGRFLVVRYYIKHIATICLSLAMMGTTFCIFELIGSEIWAGDSFSCDVIFYEDMFIICTLHRRTEMLAFLVINLAIITIVPVVGIWQIYFVSTSRNTESASFFEYLNDNGSVAPLASLRIRQSKERSRR